MPMKKFINDPANLTSELLDGLVQCYPNQLALKNERIVVRANPKPADKVAIVTLGGTGHEPALEGFVGEGMLDASVAGDIFAAPTLNHNGDRMSANKALRKAAKAGLNVKEIVIHEDIAQGPHTPIEDKRGLGGCIPFIKVVGAAAEEGKSLDEIVALGSTFNEGIATLSVALKTATHPQNGQEIGSIDDDKMEVGMGQHGEGGGGVMPVKTADETAALMIKSLVEATGVKSGDKAFLAINGSGATTLMEMLIVYRAAKKELEALGVSVLPGKCTELLTVQEMAGFQMILCKCCDTCAKYLAAPSDTPYWTTR